MGFAPFRNLIAAAVAVSAAACCAAESFPLRGARVVYADEYAKTKDEPWGRESAIELAQVRCRLLLPWLWGRNFGRIDWSDLK